MFIQQVRLKDSGVSTLGMWHVNGTFECFTLEDAFHSVKIPGKTRIPSGEYVVKLRDEGGMTKTYHNRYGDKHKGMLWLQDVPGFEWVYIHTGNTAEHTEGCILLGDGCSVVGDPVVTSSVSAYGRLYPIIAAAIENGEEVTISII